MQLNSEQAQRAFARWRAGWRKECHCNEAKAVSLCGEDHRSVLEAYRIPWNLVWEHDETP